MAQSLTITTIAGSPTANGSQDGIGAAAGFGSISALCVDPLGNIYALDPSHYTIRKITPSGTVTTTVGTAGVKEYRDGMGPSAHLFQPVGLVRDTTGNLYFGDWDLHGAGEIIREVKPDGTVSTLALGNGGEPLAIDPNNYMLVAGQQVQEYVAGSIFLIGPWTVPPAGTPPPLPIGNFGNIQALAIGPDRSLYIADGSKDEIRKVTLDGTMTSFAGSPGVAGYLDGVGSAARFNSPVAIAVNSRGEVFVGDGNNPVLRKITPDGAVTTVAGLVGAPVGSGYPDGVGSSARFAAISALAIGSDDTVYIADLDCIRKATPTTARAQIVASPVDQVVPAGGTAHFSVAANGSPAVSYQWQRQSGGTSTWQNVSDDTTISGSAQSTLNIASVTPAMNGDRYRCTVTNTIGADTSTAALLTIDPPLIVVPLRVTTLAGKPVFGDLVDGTGGAARFNNPMGIATDLAGNIFVSDQSGNRIRKITPDGIVTTLAGSGSPGFIDGPGSAAQFRQPGPIAVDAEGNVYVADQLFSPDFSYLPAIRKITPTGYVSTIAQGTAAGPSFGTIWGLAMDPSGNLAVSCSKEQMVWYDPTGKMIQHPTIAPERVPPGTIAYDASGNLYVGSFDIVYKLNPTGEMTIVAGAFGVGGAVDGPSNLARFNGIAGITLDQEGNVFVTDAGNEAIRKITPDGHVTTVAGILPTQANANPGGAVDGLGAAARFGSPRGVSIDRAGNLYIVDTFNQEIRRANTADAVSLGDSAELDVLAPAAVSTTEVAFGSASVAATPGRGMHAALATATSYQWYKDSVALPGATTAQYVLASATTSDAGNYSVQVTTSGVSLMSAAVALSVTGSRLTNLSIRGTLGTDAQTMIVGFVAEGGGIPLLVRGVGPGLLQFGVADAASNPQLSLYSGQELVTTNAGWANNADVASAANRVGAFALLPNSTDSAISRILDAGGFTVQCTGTSGGGVALVELYDASVTSAGHSQLKNISARGYVGLGGDLMIVGFAIRGTVPLQVLIRGVGPTLSQFGVGGVLADPQMVLIDANSVQLARNDNWGDNANAAAIGSATHSVGAFDLPANGKDAALLVTLPPGNYSALLSGVGGTTGIGLLEVYAVGN